MRGSNSKFMAEKAEIIHGHMVAARQCLLFAWEMGFRKIVLEGIMGLFSMISFCMLHGFYSSAVNLFLETVILLQTD